MLVLGVETSCDDTGVALVRDGRLVAERIGSQADLHSLFGGVVPEIASREHLRLLTPLARSLLDEADVGPESIDTVAAARGPGLLGSLLVGLSFAKGFASVHGARLVGVNHLHAHLLAPGLERELPFPALGLLVSGGHTQTYRIADPFTFELLGRTLDDAVGEAFDKTAKMLNLPYPGGPHVDALARLAEPDPELFPRPYIDNPNLDFSFSGLKTAMALYLEGHPELKLARMPESTDVAGELAPSHREALAHVLASFSFAVVDALRIKVERALDRTRDARSLIVSGGVAANSMLRAAMGQLASERGLELVLPSLRLCADNAAMIAYAGWLLAQSGYRHGLDLEAVPRGRAVPWDYTRES